MREKQKNSPTTRLGCSVVVRWSVGGEVFSPAEHRHVAGWYTSRRDGVQRYIWFTAHDTNGFGMLQRLSGFSGRVSREFRRDSELVSTLHIHALCRSHFGAMMHAAVPLLVSIPRRNSLICESL